MNELSIHPEKTEFMVIDNPRRQSKLPEQQPFYLDIKSLQYKLEISFTRSLPTCTDLPWIRANLFSISSKGEISDLF